MAPALAHTLRRCFTGYLSAPLIRTMTEVVGAVVLVSTVARGWHGRLTQCSIARSMTTPGSVKSRAKRLGRLLCNKRFDVSRAVQGLVAFCGVDRWGEVIPVLIDQTSLCKNAVQAIVASVPWGYRSIPFAVATFDCEQIADSQNVLEWSLLERLLGVISRPKRAVFVMDRGYAKLVHITKLIATQTLFIIRGCRNVIVQYHAGQQGTRRVSLGRLPHRQGVARRYSNVLYRDGGRERVDIVVYRERGFQEPWFLILPCLSEDTLPTDLVVQWYRWRMRIEVTFRDLKSWLGADGLRFKGEAPEKMARLLICMAVAYTVLVAMGATQEGLRTRKSMETRRRTPRHGTRRTLSVLTIAIITLSNLLMSSQANARARLAEIMGTWTAGIFSTGIQRSA